MEINTIKIEELEKSNKLNVILITFVVEVIVFNSDNICV